ncbi:MAG: carbohydrate-binding protein [Solirubrobacterales bacterium]
MGKAYIHGGISMDPIPPSTGSHVEIQYDGLLAKRGADRVWIRVGYGFQDRWYDVQEIEMQRKGGAFSTHVPVLHTDPMHFCFKDSANHWDNNNGQNWNTDVNTDNMSYA